jgi:hypothetical protein
LAKPFTRFIPLAIIIKNAFSIAVAIAILIFIAQIGSRVLRKGDGKETRDSITWRAGLISPLDLPLAFYGAAKFPRLALTRRTKPKARKPKLYRSFSVLFAAKLACCGIVVCRQHRYTAYQKREN